jgi:hypothetical protein
LPVLSGLLTVQQEVTGPNHLDTVIAIERFLTRGIVSFEGTAAHDVLLPLFGLTPATNDALAKQRRHAAADKARVDRETFVRHDEARYLQLLARRLYALESETRLRAERLGPLPEPGEIKASWLERFTRYHRIAAVLRLLRLDLLAVLITYREDHGEASQVDYLDSTLWLLARFETEMEASWRDFGGVWLMPDPAADDEAKAAVEQVQWVHPFNERGRAWFRITLKQSKGELYEFARRVHDGPDGNELLGMWEQWLEACKCEDDHRNPGCQPHRLIDQAERFDIVVEEQWPKVRDRYRLHGQDIDNRHPGSAS